MRRTNILYRFLKLTVNNDNDFLWKYDKNFDRLLTSKHVDKLNIIWTTSPTSKNCRLRVCFVQDTLNHQIRPFTELKTHGLLLHDRLTELITVDSFIFFGFQFSLLFGLILTKNLKVQRNTKFTIVLFADFSKSFPNTAECKLFLSKIYSDISHFRI